MITTPVLRLERRALRCLPFALGGLLVAAAANAAVPFATAQSLVSSPVNPELALALDVDRDGDLDLVELAVIPGRISWHENDGALQFTAHPVTTEITDPVDLTSADFDGDGDPDLIVAAGDPELHWYENLGTDAFADHAITDLVAPGGWDSVAAADLDRDGDPDLVAAAFGDDLIVVFENFGGAFAAGILTDQAAGVFQVATADVDGDGDTDLLSASIVDGTFVWWEQGSVLGFTPHPLPIVAGLPRAVTGVDLDRDGDLDVVAAAGDTNVVVWYENDGEQGFTSRPVGESVAFPTRLSPIDLDADGDLDLIVAQDGSASIRWFENLGGATFSPRSVGSLVSGLSAVVPADLDRDGDPDLLAASSAADQIVWHRNLSKSSTARPAVVQFVDPVGDGPSGVDAGDLDGDGDLDLVASEVGADKVSWYEFHGGASYTGFQVAAADAQFVDGVNSVELFDFDRDGDLDLLSAAAVGDDVAWHENLGGVHLDFAHHLIDGTADGVRHATAGDLDGDGALDVVAAVVAENAIHWYRGDGSGGFDPGLAAATAVAGVRSVDLGDIDRDGDLDIAFAASGGNQIGWLRNNGAVPPTFTRIMVPETFANPFWIRIADYDGDGRPDLLVTSFVNDQVAWYRNQGGAVPLFGQASLRSGVAGATDIETADLDADGDLDFVVTARDADRAVWFENRGAGEFPFFRQLSPPLDGALSLVAADLDGDGTIDLAVANESEGSVVRLPNVRAIFWDDFERADVLTWSDALVGDNFGRGRPSF